MLVWFGLSAQSLAAVGASRRRLLLLGDVLAGRRAAARVKPALEVSLENADAALRNLHLRWTSACGEHALERAADDARPIGGLIETKNLHLCDLFALGRLIFLARRGVSDA